MGLFSFAESKKFLGLSSASVKGPRYVDVQPTALVPISSHSPAAFSSSSRAGPVGPTSLEEDCRPLASQVDPGRHSARVDRRSPIAKLPLRFGTWIARQAARIACLQGHDRPLSRDRVYQSIVRPGRHHRCLDELLSGGQEGHRQDERLHGCKVPQPASHVPALPRWKVCIPSSQSCIGEIT